MPYRNPEFPQKTLQIKQEDKFFSRLLSKENSATNPSFRVYYGVVAGEVPFVWESQPGTPKHKYSDDSARPLTPPPSYYFTQKNKNPNRPKKNHSGSKLLNALLLKINPKKTHLPASPSFSSSSSCSLSSRSSTQYSSVSVPATPSRFHGRRRRRFLSFGSSVDDEEQVRDSAASALCFGFGRKTGTEIRFDR